LPAYQLFNYHFINAFVSARTTFKCFYVTETQNEKQPQQQQQIHTPTSVAAALYHLGVN